MKNRLSKAQAAYENALENVENLHIKISEGNTKLGAIPSVSLLPVMDCGNCAICAKSCYDLRNDMIYKEVIKTRAINSAIYHEDPERYFKEIDDYLNYRYPEHSDSTSVATYRTNGILTRCARLLASIRIPSSWRSPRCSMCATSISMRETSFPRTCTSYSADGLVSRWITDTDSRRHILSSRAERLLRKEHVYVPATVLSV